ncbi:hypothetical protein CLOP_g1120 [Closterium sp. NIES-67]|nr:hypothetical protein CLOP_g1120 [Closterium sp. NIES-67]
MRSPRVVRGKKVHAAEDRDWLSDDDSFLDSEEMEWDDGDFVDGPHTAVDQPTRAEVNQQGQAWQLPSSTHQPSSSQGRRQRHVPTSVPCTSQQAPGDELLTAEVPLVIGTTCAATDTVTRAIFEAQRRRNQELQRRVLELEAELTRRSMGPALAQQGGMPSTVGGGLQHREVVREYMIKAIEILFFLASNEGFTICTFGCPKPCHRSSPNNP